MSKLASFQSFEISTRTIEACDVSEVPLLDGLGAGDVGEAGDVQRGAEAQEIVLALVDNGPVR